MRRAVGSRLASIVVTCLSAAVAAEGTSSAGVVVAVSVVSVAGRTSSGVVVPPTRFTLFSQGQVLEVEAIGGSGVSGVGGVLPGADHAVSHRVCRLCATSCSGVSGIPGWARTPGRATVGRISERTARASLHYWQACARFGRCPVGITLSGPSAGLRCADPLHRANVASAVENQVDGALHKHRTPASSAWPEPVEYQS